jgi:hypothetical protein
MPQSSSSAAIGASIPTSTNAGRVTAVAHGGLAHILVSTATSHAVLKQTSPDRSDKFASEACWGGVHRRRALATGSPLTGRLATRQPARRPLSGAMISPLRSVQATPVG